MGFAIEIGERSLPVTGTLVLLAGQGEALDPVVERVLWPIQHPELLRRLGLSRRASLLLYGPSGCGKTLIGRATAGELHDRLSGMSLFLRVKAGALKSKWYGETTSRIQRLFRQARQRAAEGSIIVLFIDEVDSLAGARSGYGGEYGMRADHDATNALLAEIDGFDSDPALPLSTIASTNLEASLDSAFLGRFGIQLCVRRPDADAAGAILRIHLNHETPTEGPMEGMVERAVDHIFHDPLNGLLTAYTRDGRTAETIRRSHLTTGRSLAHCVERSNWLAFRDVVLEGAEPCVRPAHLLRALDEHYSQAAQKLTPLNIGSFIDAPIAREGQVARLAPIAGPTGVAPGAHAAMQYVA